MAEPGAADKFETTRLAYVLGRIVIECRFALP
jgi:hypothetical protein